MHTPSAPTPSKVNSPSATHSTATSATVDPFATPLQHVDTPEAAMQRVVQLFNQLQPSDVSRLHEFYTADAKFKDPFNDVQGVPAIERIFSHMYVALDKPRFVVTQLVHQGEHAFVTWDFLFAMRKYQPHVTQTIRGATHFVLREEQGVWRVAVHRDYWDAAEELYEKLPVVGSLMRWLKRQANS
jgi:ketosteroid isomerase-like protein